MNVIFVSHCNFKGNSALHVHSIASELYRRGHSPLICVPSEPETVSALGASPFPVYSFDDVGRRELSFPNGLAADVIHAFTPREHVRKQVMSLCARYTCPYVVHLEDNEEAIVDDELGDLNYRGLERLPPPVVERLLQPWRTYPHRALSFLSGAAGVTVLMDRLLEFKPPAVPGAVFWPGFDPTFLRAPERPMEFRRSVGLTDSDLVLVYTGDVHHSNLAEVRSLFLAVGLLRRAGHPARLLKTGWNRVDMGFVTECGLQDWVTDLGYLPRGQVPKLLHSADILVQPGGPNRFNDYRFPSKLPEFLASGKPVVLPRSNIGRFLRDGDEALLLERGDAAEIFEKVSVLAKDGNLCKRLGAGGREFAVSRLSWRYNVERILELYGQARTQSPEAAFKRHAEAAAVERLAVPRPKLIAICPLQIRSAPEVEKRGGRTSGEGPTAAVDPGHVGPPERMDSAPIGQDSSESLEPGGETVGSFGIQGLCYLHRWSDGDRASGPPAEKLASKHPGTPFCLCWVNADPDGAEGQVPRRRDYPSGWAERCIRDLLPALSDDRYICVGGARLLLIHLAHLLTDPAHLARRWREIARTDAGLELHLAAVGSLDIGDPRSFGFDAAVGFTPSDEESPHGREPLSDSDPAVEALLGGHSALPDRLLVGRIPDYPWYPFVTAHGEDAAKREGEGAPPARPPLQRYEDRLRLLVVSTLGRCSAQETLIFVSASSEWTQGGWAEHDEHFDLAWQESTREALREGIRTYWAIKGFKLTRAEALDELRANIVNATPRFAG